MLNDLDTTLEKIIYLAGKISRNEVDIAFEQPNREWSARINRPTINLWAFDIRENTKLRNTTRNVSPHERSATINLPTRRIDVSYWVTAWARKIEDEHQLLWRGLYALKKTHHISPRDAEGDLRYSEIEIPLRVAEFGEQPVNTSDLWGVLDNSMRLGFVTVVTLELNLDAALETPLVLEKTLRFGQREPAPNNELAELDTTFVQKGGEQDKKVP